MAYPYDTPFNNNNKVDLDTFPEVAAVNKVLAPEVNAILDALNALIDGLTRGEFHGLCAESSAEVAGTGEVRLRAGLTGLEVSFDGGAYAPLSAVLSLAAFGSTPDAKGASVSGTELTMQPCDGTHPGSVSLGAQTLGSGVKALASALKLLSDPSAPSSGANEVCLRSNAGALEVSQNGGAYAPLSAVYSGTPAALTSTGAHIAVNLASGLNWYHTTTENTTLDAPTGAAAGQSGAIELNNGATPYTVAFNPFWKFSGGVVPAILASANSKNLLVYYVNQGGASATCCLIGAVA